MKLQGGSWTNRLLNKGLVASHEEVVKDASCAAEDPHALVDMVAKDLKSAAAHHSSRAHSQLHHEM